MQDPRLISGGAAVVSVFAHGLGSGSDIVVIVGVNVVCHVALLKVVGGYCGTNCITDLKLVQVPGNGIVQANEIRGGAAMARKTKARPRVATGMPAAFRKNENALGSTIVERVRGRYQPEKKSLVARSDAF